MPEDVLATGRRAAEIRTDLTFLLRADDPGFVYYIEVRGRGVFLRGAPIDVSAIVRELLLDRMKATILTSATLTVDGSFDYIRSRLGIRRAKELRLSSEFDYATRAILYLPKRMPDPKSREFAAAVAREVVEIVKRTRGRAFVLFTSYANLREVQALASAEIEYPILVQGTAPRSALLREFKATPNAVLLATSSFWQGVDVVGEALSCVIIDKLPFASPGDPITSARIEAINARGGFGVRRIPDPAGDPRAAAGARPAAPPPAGSRGPRGPRPAAAHDGLRPAVPRVPAARAGHEQARGHRALHGREHLSPGGRPR